MIKGAVPDQNRSKNSPLTEDWNHTYARDKCVMTHLPSNVFQQRIRQVQIGQRRTVGRAEGEAAGAFCSRFNGGDGQAHDQRDAALGSCPALLRFWRGLGHQARRLRGVAVVKDILPGLHGSAGIDARHYFLIWVAAFSA